MRLMHWFISIHYVLSIAYRNQNEMYQIYSRLIYVLYVVPSKVIIRYTYDINVRS